MQQRRQRKLCYVSIVPSLTTVARPVGFTLENIDLTIQPGQLVGIVGPVGSSKSSLLMAILREINPQTLSIGNTHDVGLVGRTVSTFIWRLRFLGGGRSVVSYVTMKFKTASRAKNKVYPIFSVWVNTKKTYMASVPKSTHLMEFSCLGWRFLIEDEGLGDTSP